MKGFKLSKIQIHCPVHRVKVKRHYYRTILVISSIAILTVHYYSPEHETHAATLLNLLFALDPTV
jgi:hypothetical protein